MPLGCTVYGQECILQLKDGHWDKATVTNFPHKILNFLNIVKWLESNVSMVLYKATFLNEC